MGQFSAPNYELHDEQNDWSPNDKYEWDDAPEPDYDYETIGTDLEIEEEEVPF